MPGGWGGAGGHRAPLEHPGWVVHISTSLPREERNSPIAIKQTHPLKEGVRAQLHPGKSRAGEEMNGQLRWMF